MDHAGFNGAIIRVSIFGCVTLKKTYIYTVSDTVWEIYNSRFVNMHEM